MEMSRTIHCLFSVTAHCSEFRVNCSHSHCRIHSICFCCFFSFKIHFVYRKCLCFSHIRYFLIVAVPSEWCAVHHACAQCSLAQHINVFSPRMSTNCSFSNTRPKSTRHNTCLWNLIGKNGIRLTTKRICWAQHSHCLPADGRSGRCWTASDISTVRRLSTH